MLIASSQAIRCDWRGNGTEYHFLVGFGCACTNVAHCIYSISVHGAVLVWDGVGAYGMCSGALNPELKYLGKPASSKESRKG